MPNVSTGSHTKKFTLTEFIFSQSSKYISPCVFHCSVIFTHRLRQAVIDFSCLLHHVLFSTKNISWLKRTRLNPKEDMALFSHYSKPTQHAEREFRMQRFSSISNLECRNWHLSFFSKVIPKFQKNLHIIIKISINKLSTIHAKVKLMFHKADLSYFYVYSLFQLPDKKAMLTFNLLQS